MRRFELVEGTSSKFWEVSVDEKELVVRFGRIGTQGQTQLKAFPTAEKAAAERDKLVKEKTKKGYSEVTAPEAEAGGKTPLAEVASPKVAAPRAEKKVTPAPSVEGFVDAGNGYALALRDGKILCRNGKGALLSSVPKDVKETDAFQQLDDVRALLEQQDKQAIETVETWMLRTLPVPRDVLAAVWEDPSWRKALENAVVVAGEVTGFFRGVDGKRLGVVDLEGETRWLEAETLSVPHPILLGELDELRGLATELSLTQGIGQLFREVHGKPLVEATAHGVTDYRDGQFQQLNHALSRCRKLGYRVRGGSAIARVFEADPASGAISVQEARFWIGSDDPTSPTVTEDLTWVDERERALPLARVGPIAWSEGVRMAAAIFAGRHVEKEAQNG